MKLSRILTVFVVTIAFSIPLAAQELPDGFAFEKSESMVYHVQPKPDSIAKAVSESGSYQAIGIAGRLLDNLFAIDFVNAVNEKGDYIFEKQKNVAIVLEADGEKITVEAQRYVDKKKIGKVKLEIMVIRISMEDFEKILAANKVYLGFGKIDLLASAENLQAFRYLSRVLENEEALRDTAAASGPSLPDLIHVKGYYRTDGTYVRPHTRRKPRN